MTTFQNREASVSSFRQSRFLMGCFFDITVSSSDPILANAALEVVFTEIKSLEDRLSRFIKTSEVSLLNREAGSKTVKVSEEVFSLLELSLQLSEQTHGCFDITAFPLTQLWKQSQKENKQPRQRNIDEAVKNTGWRKVILDRTARTVSFSSKQVQIDLGAIGKGYAVDQCIKILKERGISCATVSCGSTIATYGKESHTFLIEDPTDSNQFISEIKLENKAISTTSAGERFFVIKNKKFGHVIDPRRGYSAKKCLSVSVIDSSAARSDALSTAIFVGGKPLAKALKKEYPTSQFLVQINPFLSIGRRIVSI